MANVDGGLTSSEVFASSGGAGYRDGDNLILGGGGGVAQTKFKMRGRDDGRSPGSDYIVWTHTGTSPDFAGAGFATGTPTPIGSLVASSVIVTGQGVA